MDIPNDLIEVGGTDRAVLYISQGSRRFFAKKLNPGGIKPLQGDYRHSLTPAQREFIEYIEDYGYSK